MSGKPGINLRGLSPREAVIDAVLRMTQGLDDANEALIDSAFTDNATFDLNGVKNTGNPGGTIEGKAATVKALMNSVGTRLDSLHQVTNCRVEIGEDGDTANLTAYALAQHFRRGQGVLPPDSKGYLMGNRYATKLKKDKGEGGLWKIEEFKLECRWADGDRSVMEG